ncbi:MAG: heavy metal translocating P-type ATPase, partial [Candidatus Pacebacteria bacterium]|nr:heavy metal translocating P-type ATPase [Candidatus Paceibacterota bacterium]
MISKSFKVNGMHCASCSAIISDRLTKLDGIKTVDVNFATEKAKIDFDGEKVNPDLMNSEIEKLGYTIESNEGDSSLSSDTVMNMDMSNMDHSEHLGLHSSKEIKEKELAEQKNKVWFVMPLALIIFVFMMWDIFDNIFLSIPDIPISMGVANSVLLIFATVVMFWVGKPFVLGVVRFIKYRVANMDTLIGIGTLTAYIYSAGIVLFPQFQKLIQAPNVTYFDVVIVVIGFVTFGKYLETKSKQKTGEAIEKLLNLQAKTALVMRNGVETEIFVDDVVLGDMIIVKPGGKIPVDGKIIEGNTSIDESMITGESIPSDKVVGDIVIGATINKQGSIKFEATKIGGETMLSNIIKMVEEAQGSKAPIAAMADRISSVFVPIVLVIAFTSLLVWIFVGGMFMSQATAISYGILSFVGVLVIACPCALGLATPTAIIVGVGKGAEYGILVKGAENLEFLSKVDTIVFDKTGTITKGKPEVTNVITLDNLYSEDEIIKIAGSVEKMSEHPLAEAIAKEVELRKLSYELVSNF